MNRSRKAVASSALVAGAVVWLSLRIVLKKSRRTSSGDGITNNGASAGHPKQLCGHRSGESRTDDHNKAPDNVEVVSLYTGGKGDAEPTCPPMELSDQVYSLLKSFDVDPVRGFLPSVDPLRRLPQPEFQAWEAMADSLPSLLAAGQNRKPLESLPEMPIDLLKDHHEKMRALLLLNFFAHASIWGNPKKPQDTIPKSIAVPLTSLAAAEGIPPLLTHFSLMLNNWHRLDPSGPIRAKNLACNCRFLGGLDEAWFYNIHAEVEARGGGVIGPLLEAQHAIAEATNSHSHGNSTSESSRSTEATARIVLEALGVVQAGITSMREGLSRMRVGCQPSIFYRCVRPFLAGWKANPALPDGVLYEGVSSHRKQYYGGSGAQSTLFPALDAALEVSHSKHSSNAYLLEMRNYMPPGHRRLLEHLSDPACPSIRRFVDNFPDPLILDDCADEGKPSTTSTTVSDSSEGGRYLSGKGSGKIHNLKAEDEIVGTGNALREAYNACLQALYDYRTTHIGIVTSYIVHQQRVDKKAGEARSRDDTSGGKGTGGTSIIGLLKPLKEDARTALLDK